jgi:ribosomal protein S20
MKSYGGDTLANTKSAIKRVNVSSKKQLLNTSKRSALRKLVKALRHPLRIILQIKMM